jgi:hypothetical protein
MGKLETGCFSTLFREWRKSHMGELHNLCTSPNIIIQMKTRGMMLAKCVSRMRGNCPVFWWLRMKERNLVKDKRLRWEDGIRMDLRKICLGGGCTVDLVGL